jgi:hypothetical protein
LELLLLLYAMLAGLAGVSGQGPTRAHEVALGSATAIEAAEAGAQAAVGAAIISTRAGQVLDALRPTEDARLIDAAPPVAAPVPQGRRAPERRLE